MRSALVALAFLAAAASRGGCGDAGRAPYDPCAGKACLDACHACAPDDPGCVETQGFTVCDAGGRCVASTPAVLCSPPDPCAGKACGNACVIEAPCRSDSPPCMLPDVAGQCDAGGACVPGGAFSCPAADSCMDRGCGVPCAAMDMMGPMACDGSGSCVSPSMLACTPPTDPCAGKSCGDACDLCGGMCMFPEATVCDRSGRCVFGARGTCPP
jgi:hypothetical protein